MGCVEERASVWVGLSLRRATWVQFVNAPAVRDLPVFFGYKIHQRPLCQGRWGPKPRGGRGSGARCLAAPLVAVGGSRGGWLRPARGGRSAGGAGRSQQRAALSPGSQPRWPPRRAAGESGRREGRASPTPARALLVTEQRTLGRIPGEGVWSHHPGEDLSQDSY